MGRFLGLKTKKSEAKNGFRPDVLWWARPDSNREPKDYESPAPPLSYRPVLNVDYCTRKLSSQGNFIYPHCRQTSWPSHVMPAIVMPPFMSLASCDTSRSPWWAMSLTWYAPVSIGQRSAAMSSASTSQSAFSTYKRMERTRSRSRFVRRPPREARRR